MFLFQFHFFNILISYYMNNKIKHILGQINANQPWNLETSGSRAQIDRHKYTSDSFKIVYRQVNIFSYFF
jgi:hypothetical protein